MRNVTAHTQRENNIFYYTRYVKQCVPHFLLIRKSSGTCTSRLQGLQTRVSQNHVVGNCSVVLPSTGELWQQNRFTT